MALTYREGGKRIEMSPEQEAATRARWAEAETTTKEMINDEAKRRIYLILSVPDEQSSVIKQANLRTEYARLQDVVIDGGKLTREQTARRDEIRLGSAALDAIVDASNKITAMSPTPTDYTNDKYWVI